MDCAVYDGFSHGSTTGGCTGWAETPNHGKPFVGKMLINHEIWVILDGSTIGVQVIQVPRMRMSFLFTQHLVDFPLVN